MLVAAHAHRVNSEPRGLIGDTMSRKRPGGSARGFTSGSSPRRISGDAVAADVADGRAQPVCVRPVVRLPPGVGHVGQALRDRVPMPGGAGGGAAGSPPRCQPGEHALEARAARCRRGQRVLVRTVQTIVLPGSARGAGADRPPASAIVAANHAACSSGGSRVAKWYAIRTRKFTALRRTRQPPGAKCRRIDRDRVSLSHGS